MACNNEAANEQKATDTTNVIKSDTTTTAVETLPATNPTDSSAKEFIDDSIFADGSIPSSWTNAGFTDPVAFKKFLKQLQYWVANDQKDSVANAIAYPLRNPAVRNKESFLTNYNTYITDHVKKALREQNLHQIFRNAQGAMVGDGKLWITPTRNGYKIIAINK